MTKFCFGQGFLELSGDSLDSGKNVSYHNSEISEKIKRTSYQSIKSVSVSDGSQFNSYSDNSQFKRGIVRFSNISVEDLPKKDSQVSINPSVLIRIGDEEKSTSIANNSTSFDYQNENIDLLFDPSLMQKDEKAIIEVWDCGNDGKGEIIGMAYVDIIPPPVLQAKLEVNLTPKINEAEQQSMRSNASQRTNKYIGKVKLGMTFIQDNDQQSITEQEIQTYQSVESHTSQKNIQGNPTKEACKAKEVMAIYQVLRVMIVNTV
ncbi:MAG: hypothetical protein EZS28_020481 [Streblomastix strix]|uniref:C2 domain-containing protein n=1 Tax=Streblomastix strix TaxID=222440 RepID=A0A5J4VNX7_9EUKA|nr:MAG: hypothetical protein EZS28_020481 [Streblomastix strix]